MESRFARVRLGQRLLSALLKPGVTLMNRLKFPQKMAIISALFCIPLAMMMTLLIADIDHEIKFTCRELNGTHLVRPLRKLLEQVPVHAALAVEAAANQASQESLTRTNIEIDSELKALGALNTLESDLPGSATPAELLDRLTATWRFAKAAPPGPVAQVLHERLQRQVRGLFQQVADRSNLVCDPELDIFYLMDSVLLKLPESIDLLGRASRACRATATPRRLSAGERAEVTSLNALIRSNDESFGRELATALHQKSLRGSESKMRMLYDDYEAALKRFHYEVGSLLSVNEAATGSARITAVRRAGETAISAGIRFWDRSVDLLDTLLQARMDRLETRARLLIGSTTVILLLVVYAWIAFYVAVNSTVLALGDASQRMVGGDMDGLVAVSTRDELGAVVRSFNDVARRLRQEWTQAREQEAQHRLLFQSNPQPMWVSDARTDAFLAVNDAAISRFGYARDELLGMRVSDLLIADEMEPASESRVVKRRANDPACTRRRLRKRDGLIIDVEFVSNPVSFEERAAKVTLVQDITARKRFEEQLEYEATHDALTGLANLASLRECFDRALSFAQTDRWPLAVLLIDLDKFKEINDTFGHHYGDLVLKQLKPRLCSAVRQCDAVARLGGDEFGILLNGVTEEGAVLTAQRVIKCLEAPVEVEDQKLPVNASIGIALFPDHGADAATLLQRADVAMYTAKRNHAGYAVFSEALMECTPGRLTLISELRQGIETNQLLLHYQPEIELKTMKVRSAEALIRWMHPREGLLPPLDFIPLARHAGLIKPLGLWSLNTALLQCRVWRRAGLELNVAVNLASVHFQDRQLVDRVFALIDSSDALPTWLTMEIVESALTEDPALASRHLVRLHENGVRISIDDFGTGSSPLSFVKDLPIAELKIDRSFVAAMSHSERDASLVQSIIELGQNLGVQVVAEGVEDRPALERLRSLGCDIAQGYYLSHPLSPSAFSRWMGAGSEFVATEGEPVGLPQHGQPDASPT